MTETIAGEHLKRTPLYDDHVALKARMVPFGGWEMPVQYEGILAEYEQTRRAAAIFDTCHMGEFVVEGDARPCGLDRLVTMSLNDLPVKSCRYGLLLNQEGGVVDDLIVFRLDKTQWFIVVNGATTRKDAFHFQKNLKKGTFFKDISSQTGKIDLQGPLARDVLKPLVAGIEKLDYYTFDYFDLLGEYVLVSRTGYTGELGYEIFYPWGKIKRVWQELLKNSNVKPAGLGARDVLRLEMGYSLYGHELEENISPLEAGLNRFIDFNKEFIGKEALLKQQEAGISRKLVGLLSDNRRTPRSGHKIYASDQQEIGLVTSGSFSPGLNAGIGLGFVRSASATQGEKIFFGDDKNKISAIITGKSFYKQGSLKNK